jgi:uncharacterized protein (DUF1499 family)
MRRTLAIAGLALLAALLLVVGGMALLSALSKHPDTLGVHAGQLADCPGTPNCVCSTAGDDGHRIEPLRYTGAADAAFEKLKRIVTNMPGATIVTGTDRYLHAEFTSRVFRFVDDVEFLLDADAGVIQVRSASRAGKSDLGVNRARVEVIRAKLVTE